MPLTPEEAAQEGRDLMLADVTAALPIVCELIDERLRRTYYTGLDRTGAYEISIRLGSLVNNDKRLPSLTFWGDFAFGQELVTQTAAIYKQHGWLAFVTNCDEITLKPDPSPLRRLAAQAE